MGAPVQALLMAAITAAADPFWSSTVFLLHADAADGSTTFTDSSGSSRSVTVYGNAQIDTAQSKFGGSSALFDGSGDYLAAINSPDFNFLTNDFTIELFVRWNSVTNAGVFHLYPTTPGGTTGGLAVGYDGTAFQIYANDAASGRTMTVSAGQWYHLALVRQSGSLKLYVNGVAQGASITDTRSFSGNHLFLGLYYSTAYTLNGWIDEVRVTKAARYVGDFTPPIAAFPNS